MILNLLKRFFLKEDYDLERPDIDLYNFHPQLRVFIVPMGIFFNHKDSLFRYVWPVFSIKLCMVGIGLELIFIYHGLDVKDYNFAIECFCYLVILGANPLVYVGMLMNRSSVLEILDSMNEDFIYIGKLDAKYRDVFLKDQLLIWKLCYMWITFGIVVGLAFISMTLVPLTYLSLFGTINEFTIRPLIFPTWLPEGDPYSSPIYELFLLMQIFYVVNYIQTFVVYVYIQFHVLLHNVNLLGLIVIDFEGLFEGLDGSVAKLPKHDERRLAVQVILNSRMKRIVTWHKSVVRSIVNLSQVHGPPLVYQVLFSPVAWCLTLYRVADKLDEGKYDFLSAILLFAALLQLGIPCCLGTTLINKAFEVCDACWNCGWQETPLGSLVRNDILIILLRTQQPLSIKFTGLPQLSLETYSSLISTAYSYFNMLRQYN